MSPWMGEYLSFLRSDVLLRRLVRNCFCFVSVGIFVARLPVRASVLLYSPCSCLFASTPFSRMFIFS